MTSFALLGFYLICLLAALRVYVEHRILKRSYAEYSIGVQFPTEFDIYIRCWKLEPRTGKGSQERNASKWRLWGPTENRIMTNWQPGSAVSSAES